MNELIGELAKLSSAEEFLQFFAVPFDQKVVNVSRLHILKRFYQYLRRDTDLSEVAGSEMFSRYRSHLVAAYDDFVQSTPAREKVFKVFQDTDGRQQVSLDSLRATPSLRQLTRQECRHAHRRLHQTGSGFGTDPCPPGNQHHHAPGRTGHRQPLRPVRP